MDDVRKFDVRKLPLLILAAIVGLIFPAILISGFGIFTYGAISWSLLILFILWHKLVGFGSNEGVDHFDMDG